MDLNTILKLHESELIVESDLNVVIDKANKALAKNDIEKVEHYLSDQSVGDISSMLNKTPENYDKLVALKKDSKLKNKTSIQKSIDRILAYYDDEEVEEKPKENIQKRSNQLYDSMDDDQKKMYNEIAKYILALRKNGYTQVQIASMVNKKYGEQWLKIAKYAGLL